MDWSKLFSGGLGGGMVGQGLFGLFGGGGNPYKGASSTMGQIPGSVSPYYQPYIDMGKQAMGQYSDLLSGLAGDPTEFYSKLAGGYQESPGYKRQLEQALSAGTNAAAAGGMLGTPAHERQNMELAQDIASKDFQNYMGGVSGLFGQGLSGLGGLTGMGYGASTGLGDIIGSNMAQQAQMQMMGDMFNQQRKGQGMGSIFGGLGMLGSLF